MITEYVVTRLKWFGIGVAACLVFGLVARYAWGWGVPEPIDRVTADSLKAHSDSLAEVDRIKTDSLGALLAIIARDSAREDTLVASVAAANQRASAATLRHSEVAGELRGLLEDQPEALALVDTLETQVKTLSNQVDSLTTAFEEEKGNADRLRDAVAAQAELLGVKDARIESLQGEIDFWKGEAERLEVVGFDPFAWLPDSWILRELTTGAMCAAAAYGADKVAGEVDSPVSPFILVLGACEAGHWLTPRP